MEYLLIGFISYRCVFHAAMALCVKRPGSDQLLNYTSEFKRDVGHSELGKEPTDLS